MGSLGPLCFSAASILRCESFTSLQSQILIIPTALELIFSTTLVITNWGTGWRHLLLTAEGWSYFALALLELLSHNIPAVRDSVTVFSIVDIVLGATSFLPIFFYTLFVYLFTRGELIDTLPKRFQRIANVLLVFFIPAIIALNELSSFIGISRRTLVSSDGRPFVAIGFSDVSDQGLSGQQLWTFLTSLTLALLTAFEAINFCFAFYRLIRAFVDQRRIETTSSDSAHLIRGIGWISGGFKLGAIETVIGFAQGGFGGALTRRIIRFLARAFLIIGIVKGVDQVDDFAEVAKEMSGGRANAFRRSRLGMLISNPRFSTFRQLSPTAKEFYTAPRAGEKPNEEAPPQMSEFAQIRRGIVETQPPSPIYTLSGPMVQQQRRQITPPQPSTLQRSLTQQTTSTTASRQRVTVQYSAGTAPTLHMRFSGLEMPSPAVIAENVKSRPLSASWVSIARESRYAPSIAPSFAFDPVPPMTAPPVPVPAPVPAVTYPQFIYERKPEPAPESTLGDAQSTWSYHNTGKGKAARHTRGTSEFSVRSSVYPDSLSAVRELADQFPVPGIPPTQRPTPIPEQWEDTPAPSLRQRQWDAERGDPPPVRYTYGGMEYPEAEADEPVYQYAYDGPVSPERIPHPYAAAAAYAYSAAQHDTDAVAHSPPRMNAAYSPAPSDAAYANMYSPPRQNQNNQTRHRNIRSDTTMGTTPRTNLSSRFDAQSSQETSTPNTEAESDPFQFDVALDTGLSGKAAYARRQQQQQQEEEYAAYSQEGQGVPEEVYMDDGPHSYRGQHAHNASVATRTSAALLQMTQRGNADWTPAGVEFTPSVFTASSAPSSRRNTLRKKRRPDAKGDVPESVDTLASSWLRGDGLHDDEMVDADDELPQMAAGGGNAGFGRVKSVGRVRAPRKATPAPVAPRHGLMRGSVSIQPIMVPPAVYSSEVQIVQGGSSADSYNSEFAVSDRP